MTTKNPILLTIRLLMTLSPVVLSVLVACWTIPAAILLVRYWNERTQARSTADAERKLEVVRRQITVDITSHMSTTPSGLDSRRSHGHRGFLFTPDTTSIQREVPHAECSVHVFDDTGAIVERHCSVCMN